MVAPDDVISARDTIFVLGSLLLGSVAWTLRQFVKRLDKHEADDSAKFDQLFRGQETIADRIAQGFRDLDKTINVTHLDVLEKLNDHIQNGDRNG